MIYSRSPKFVFIHVPKTAGTSISEHLWDYRPPWDRGRLGAGFDRLAEYGCPESLLPLGTRIRTQSAYDHHPSAAEVRDILPADEQDDWFLFAFVRNPWDWEVSQYHFGREHPEFPNHDIFIEFDDFEEYVHWRAENGPVTQAQYVANEDDEILVDFLGRFEHLSRDFNRVCDILGLDVEPLPKKNTTDHDHYTDYYTPEMRELIRECNSRDIELFGYEFEDDGKEELEAVTEPDLRA